MLEHLQDNVMGTKSSTAKSFITFMDYIYQQPLGEHLYPNGGPSTTIHNPPANTLPTTATS